MKDPVFSFIVPVYNAQPYLEECLTSIARQNSPNIEIIVVDDGSTDGSPEIYNRLAAADSRFRILKRKNAGAGAARNAGLDIAKGQYVIFVDADDFIDRNLTDIVEKGIHADVIYFGFVSHLGDKTIQNPIQLHGNHTGYMDNILSWLFTSPQRFFGFTWNKAFRRQVIEDHHIRFDPELIIKEDEDFCVRFTNCASTIFVMPQMPYHYRVLPNSLSHGRRRNRRLTLLGERIAADAENCPRPCFRKILFDAAYGYFLDGFRDAEPESFEKWDAFVHKHRRSLSKSNSMIGLFNIPGSSLRKAMLAFAFRSRTTQALRKIKLNLKLKLKI